MTSHRLYPIFKSAADRLFALCLFILLAPVFAIIALLIFLSMGRPVWFTQRRIGYRNKPFTITKFRTMTTQTDTTGTLLPDHERLTRCGRLIRNLSLDELPQLLNIIKGDMSFIGPRPLIEKYLPRYSDEQRQRHNVKPGITGWSQINGRNTVTWEERFKQDLYYVRHQSFLLDLKIGFKTIAAVLGAKNINQDDIQTMPEFNPQEKGD